MSITFNKAGDNGLALLDLGQPGPGATGSGRHAAGRAASSVTVNVGSPVVARQGWSYPGVDGVFVVKMGVRDRPIQWGVSLRAIDDGELNDIEAEIENYITDARGYIMTDQPGREYADVILIEFLRLDRRVPIESAAAERRDAPLRVRQDGILRFLQQ